MNLRELYSNQIKAHNIEGSGTATSYISALNFLDGILTRTPLFGHNAFWDISSAADINTLYHYALENQKTEGSVFLDGQLPPSYGRGGYYSAALKSYKEFLVTHLYEQQMWDAYQDSEIAPDQLPAHLANIEVESAELLVEDKDLDLTTKVGKDAVREVKTRIGQSYFRKMILKQYGTQCCITGLNVPEVLRASHITGWAEDPKNRMNPANGLCLSATYDAAFDKHLISFDDDYRMILSPALKEFYTNKAFKECFLDREDSEISLPTCYLPDLELLKRHRDRMIR